MGNGKISPLIIIVLLLLLALIGFAVVSVLGGSSKTGGGSGDTGKTAEELIVPVITATLSSEEPDQSEIVISLKVQINDEEGIESITLPDGSIITAAEATYTVTENGTYSFKAKSVSGEVTTKDVEIKNIRIVSADNPYIPAGFSYVGGDINKGYTIQDSYGNQYVWVPCPSGMLHRDTVTDIDYKESSDSALSLVNSVAKYYGFYMGRFEASSYDTGNGLVASTRAGQIPWTDVTYIDALHASISAAKVFGYEEDISTNIISSYAWDTVLKWFNTTLGTSYSSSLSYGNFDGTIKPTGTTPKDCVNNIYDMAGNVREWTTEIYESAAEAAKSSSTKKEEKVINRVVRGGSANLSRTAASHTAYAENTSETYWGFRTVLYKN